MNLYICDKIWCYLGHFDNYRGYRSMEFRLYVKKTVSSFVKNPQQKAIFVKHYNTLDISQEEILDYVDKKERSNFWHHEYALNEMHSAYEPFLGWISECYHQYYEDDMFINTFLEKCNVYSMHIEPLAEYILRGNCKRTEEVIYAETDYETRQMLSSLISIVEYISKDHPIVMFLSKFHMAPYSTMHFVKQLLKVDIPNFHMIVTYNDVFRINDYKKAIWSELIHDVEEMNLQLEWGSLDSQTSMDMQDEFLYKQDMSGQYFWRLINMYHTFALEDAYFYMDDIIKKCEQKSIWMDPDSKRLFYELAAYIYLGMGNVSQTLVTCDTIKLLYNIEEDPRVNYMYHFICAKAQTVLLQHSLVKMHCEKCVKIARKMSNELLEYKAEVLLFISQYSGWRDIFHYNFQHQEDYTFLVDKTEKFCFWNFMAYLYVFGFENDDETVKKIATGEKEPYYFRKGIELGKKLNNKHFLQYAYIKNVICYSNAGYHKYVRKMYEERLEVFDDNNLAMKSNMLAGIAYNNIILSDYGKANDCLMKSIHMLTTLELPESIMDSLYNMAFNFVVAESYEDAVFVLNHIFKMLEYMGCRTMQVSSTEKLYGLLAISYFQLKQYYNAYFYLNKMDVLISPILSPEYTQDHIHHEEDLFLYHFIKGLLYELEENFQSCQEEMEQAKAYMFEIPGTLFYSYPMFAKEQYRILKTAGNEQAAEAIITEAIEFCDKAGHDLQKERLCTYKETLSCGQPLCKLDKATIPFDKILQIARNEGFRRKLVKKEKDIDFLTIWQEVILKDDMTIEEIIQNATAILQNTFRLTEIVILRKEADRKVVLHQKGDTCLTEEQIEGIFAFFHDYKRAFLTNRIDKNFNLFEPVMKCFSMNQIMTMIGIPIVGANGVEDILLAYVNIQRSANGNKELLDADDLLILKFAFSQFYEAMKKIDYRRTIEDMNRKLEKAAVTDYLTGICNRNGLSQKLDEILLEKGNKGNVLLYVDLDNFKYYNDTFGHDVGDMVLVCFSRILEKVADKKAVPVRYGGDEFILLLPDKQVEEGVKVAERIYQEIQDGFCKEIQEMTGHEVVIPKEKKLSCSIGIAASEAGSVDGLYKALTHADQMLYHVKKHGKGRLMVYNDLEEQTN